MGRAEKMIADLLDLSPDEQAKIRAALTHVSTDSTDHQELSGSVDADVATVWATVVRLADKQGITLPHAGIVVRNRNYSRLVTNCKSVVAFVDRFSPVNKIERSLALDLCVESVLRYMNERMPNAPISVRTLTDQLANVSQAVDHQLPGYAAAGLLHVAISGLKMV